jgi:UDP-N-acetylglucosamine:LPS N-acetylglucosamine transferase
MGLANKLISKFATKIFYTFPGEYENKEKHIITGPIMNTDLLSNI